LQFSEAVAWNKYMQRIHCPIEMHIFGAVFIHLIMPMFEKACISALE